MPKIVIHYPDGSQVKYGLNGKVFTVGRAENNDIVLKDGASSSYHAVLKLTESGNFAVTDLESTNHTRVNGAVTETRVLANGDIVHFGDTRTEYLSDIVPGRQPDEQATQIYEHPPAAVPPRAPVVVAQPARPGAPGASGPAVVQPYVIQRPVSTFSRRGGGAQDGGCFAMVVMAFVLPFVFIVGMTIRHWQDAKPGESRFIWELVRDYIHG